MNLEQYLTSNKDLFLLNEQDILGIIISRNVLVNDIPITHRGYTVKTNDIIRLRNQKVWVARSADKLLSAIQKFHFNIKNKNFIDIGSSTGGFTEVLLTQNANLIMSVDVGYGIIHPKIKNNKKVILKERTNIFDITHEDILANNISSFVADVSFVSIKKILLHLKTNLFLEEGIILFKPQFELTDKEKYIYLDKGILKNKEKESQLLEDFRIFLKKKNINEKNFMPSSIKGSKGNQEFLFHLKLANSN